MRDYISVLEADRKLSIIGTFSADTNIAVPYRFNLAINTVVAQDHRFPIVTRSPMATGFRATRRYHDILLMGKGMRRVAYSPIFGIQGMRRK